MIKFKQFTQLIITYFKINSIEFSNIISNILDIISNLII